MCRIFMCNKKGLNLIENTYGSLKLLDLLEKSMGGAGNGYLLIKDNKIIKSEKGLELKNSDILSKINTDFDWFLYHTRVPSRGSKTDANCHPYINEDSSFAIMMNGTVQGVGDLAKDIDITDTEMVFRIINKGLLDVTCIKNVTPNFIGFKDGKVFACNNGYSDGLKFIDKDGAIVISSELPFEIEDYKTLVNCFWWEGEKLEARKSYTEIYKEYYKPQHFDSMRFPYSLNTRWYGDEYSVDEIEELAKEFKKKIAIENNISETEVDPKSVIEMMNDVLGEYFFIEGVFLGIHLEAKNNQVVLVEGKRNDVYTLCI